VAAPGWTDKLSDGAGAEGETHDCTDSEMDRWNRRRAGVEQLHEAIRTLAVRGAPAIGVAAAYGPIIALQKRGAGEGLSAAVDRALQACDFLASSRPTAVNLFWALDRMRARAKDAGADAYATPRDLHEALLAEANAIYGEDVEMCRRIGENGEKFIEDGAGILTHCNAGALATAGQGTALSVLFEAHAKGKRFTVYADETRPLLQGARLTAWELQQAGIDVRVICDNMAGFMMKQGKIQAVITGADRIAANGDTANKIGTYSLSVLAKHHEIPFYIAAPSSTFDLSIASGAEIPIEQRSPDRWYRRLQPGVRRDRGREYLSDHYRKGGNRKARHREHRKPAGIAASRGRTTSPSWGETVIMRHPTLTP